MDSINYKAGVTGLNGSLGTSSDNSISTGFDDVTPKRLDPWAIDYEREDDSGENYVGSRYEFRKTGACGRPNGNER